jgi:hypothetical protein
VLMALGRAGEDGLEVGGEDGLEVGGVLFT